MYELEDQIETERTGRRLRRARGRDGGLFIYRAGRRPQSVAEQDEHKRLGGSVCVCGMLALPGASIPRGMYLCDRLGGGSGVADGAGTCAGQLPSPPSPPSAEVKASIPRTAGALHCNGGTQTPLPSSPSSRLVLAPPTSHTEPLAAPPASPVLRNAPTFCAMYSSQHAQQSQHHRFPSAALGGMGELQPH